MKLKATLSVIGYAIFLTKFRERIKNLLWLQGFILTGEDFISMDSFFNREPYQYTSEYTNNHYDPTKQDINEVMLAVLQVAEELDLIVTDLAH